MVNSGRILPGLNSDVNITRAKIKQTAGPAADRLRDAPGAVTLDDRGDREGGG
jgi:hypothetical protein